MPKKITFLNKIFDKKVIPKVNHISLVELKSPLKTLQGQMIIS